MSIEVSVPNGLTTRWVEEALTTEYPGIGIRDFSMLPVGTGQIADTYRLIPRYDPVGPTGPDSLIVKAPPLDEAARSVAQRSRSYRVEIEFYRNLATRLDIRVPRFWDETHNDSGDYLLLMEDAAPATPGDQLHGCTTEEAAAALSEIAGLHADCWGPLAVGSLPWIRASGKLVRPELVPHLKSIVRRFEENFEGMLGPSTTSLLPVLPELLRLYAENEEPLMAVVHGDFRIDNLLFPGDGDRPFVVDWGGTAAGSPIADVSYFIGGSLLTADRREAEQDLLRSYLESLCARGVQELSWSECWHQYAIHAVSGMTMSVLAPLSVRPTDRGNKMFVAMAERHAKQIEDLGTLDLLRAT